MSNVISLFNVSSLAHSKELPQELIRNWNNNNITISSEFHKSSAYKKQETLDSMISICNELYKMAVEAKYWKTSDEFI
ncbi:hypothetical protein [Pseudomonas sp.]|uniref:hypothetical protein n=1 Tax=Pseudomonas sp. TaxID=306 RepID=UPI003FD7B96A